jgi:hypothetical protein
MIRSTPSDDDYAASSTAKGLSHRDSDTASWIKALSRSTSPSTSELAIAGQGHNHAWAHEARARLSTFRFVWSVRSAKACLTTARNFSRAKGFSRKPCA